MMLFLKCRLIAAHRLTSAIYNLYKGMSGLKQSRASADNLCDFI